MDSLRVSGMFRILLAASFVAGALAAIDFGSLPQCAQGPILNIIGRSKCDPSKLECLCNEYAVVHDLVPLIAKSCSGQDLPTAIGFERALCPNLASQSLVTISDPQTTYVVTLDQPASATDAPATTSAMPASNVSASGTSTKAPTVSVAAGNGTSHGNGTGADDLQGHAPEFGPMRLWSTVLGMLLIGVIFAEL